jgi:hypothetical protein
MVRGIQPTKDDEITPLSSEEIGLMPAHIRMVQLFLTIETLPMFMDEVRALQERYTTENVTDTVVQAIHRCYLLPADDADITQGNEHTTDHPAGLPATNGQSSESHPANIGGTE